MGLGMLRDDAERWIGITRNTCGRWQRISASTMKVTVPNFDFDSIKRRDWCERKDWCDASRSTQLTVRTRWAGWRNERDSGAHVGAARATSYSAAVWTRWLAARMLYGLSNTDALLRVVRPNRWPHETPRSIAGAQITANVAAAEPLLNCYIYVVNFVSRTRPKRAE